ncbi:MAG: hypothetical protein AAF726_09765 [Planctomycetota bacterium]
MPPPNADILGILRVFHDAGVQFVVIGGVSAALQGVPAATFDVDLVLDPARENLDRAWEVLSAIRACFREQLPSKRLEPERAQLESPGAMLLLTDLGPLDLLGAVATGWHHDELLARSHQIEVEPDFEIRVLDLTALIEIKEAVGREKDLAVLPLYRQVLREREGNDPGSQD